MGASLEEFPDSCEPEYCNRPANVGEATTFEHAGQYIALFARELERIGIDVPKKPALLDRNDHGR